MSDLIEPSIQQDLLVMMQQCLLVPFPQICRHLVALDVAGILIKHGWQAPEGLLAAICASSDFEALELLKKEMVKYEEAEEGRS